MMENSLAKRQECLDGVEWIFRAFGECVRTSAELASFWIGMVSLVLWFFPLIPQLYVNYRRGNCDGLSLYFLLFWFAGDLFNFVGTVLADQLPTQSFVAAYYIVQDVTILGQYAYYKVKNQWRNHLVRDLGPTTLRCVMVTTAAQSFVVIPSFFHGAADEFGYSLGIVSAISYLAGRIPQLYTNFKRRSTEGVSMAMFYVIILGNFTYGLSVLLGGTGQEYFYRHMPWLVGSLGCCLLDFLLVYQHFRYKYSQQADDRAQVMNSDDTLN